MNTDQTKATYEKLQPILEEYVKAHSLEMENIGITVPVEGKKAIELAEKVLKLQEEKLKPIYEEGQNLVKQKEELEEKYKAIQEQMKALEDKSQSLVQAKGALMNRLSPMLQKQMEGKLTEFQEMQSIARGDNNEPVIRVGDYLTAFVNARRKKAIKEKQEAEAEADKLDKVQTKMRGGDMEEE